MSSFDSDISGSQSGFFTNVLISTFNFNNPEMVSLIVRKLAHISEYFVLVLLSINYFKECIKKPIGISVIFSILYACSDEFHQLFVPGRAGMISDVILDSTGVLLGCLGVYALHRVFRNIT